MIKHSSRLHCALDLLMLLSQTLLKSWHFSICVSSVNARSQYPHCSFFVKDHGSNCSLSQNGVIGRCDVCINILINYMANIMQVVLMRVPHTPMANAIVKGLNLMFKLF